MIPGNVPVFIPRPAGRDFSVRLLSDAPGLVELKPQRHAIVGVHFGPSARMRCRHGDETHHGVAIHGDVEIIPWGLAGSWELKQRDAALVMHVSPELLHAAAEESGCDPARLDLKSRFHIRDVQIEHIAWALKAELEQGNPGGRLYRDSLASALSLQLVRKHSSLSVPLARLNGKMSPGKLKHLLVFIEDHLSDDLSLAELAQAAGTSVSHCNALFRQSTGVSIHQYVIRRRVERAAWLLRESRLPISQIALDTGFAHQSHMAKHIRRLLGISPRELRSQLQ